MNTFNNSFLIIIVIYNAVLEDCESFQSVLKMVSNETDFDVFVYDNSKHSQVTKQYSGLSIRYIHDPQNPGVSKAYNAGASYAQKLNKGWVLLLDQDTALPSNIFEIYKEAVETYPKIKLFVPVLMLGDRKIFSPCRYKYKRGFHLNTISEGIHSLHTISPVNSGMLIDVQAFFKAGGYNDKVKLDFGDFQFIERFRKLYSEFYVLNATCFQDFSNDEVSYNSQLVRYKFYCDGARHIEKDTLWDTIQYVFIVLMRGLMLTLKHKKFAFISTYFNAFLFPK